MSGRCRIIIYIKRRTTIKRLLLPGLIALAVIAGCAAEKQIIVRGTAEEISELRMMISDVGAKNWGVSMAKTKTGITDQLNRTIYGMQKRKISDMEGAEIIYKAQEVIDKADDMAGSADYNSGGHRAKGGKSSGKQGTDWSGADIGKVNGQNAQDESYSGAQQDRPEGFFELKDMIDGYFRKAAGASGTTIQAEAGGSGVQGRDGAKKSGKLQ